ncbi:peptidoglycan-associated lipoprotein Pal [Caldimonas thermodepolymerans]|jgi:peptidoglycan-associated lipoprotein|uniref:Peptidoglycan-associated lipoprotein n=1 Tax=Caldimonas thermodepolymerans TaxID=215580 RepID=A0A2S5T940_9BURK|nr:peptidoglycan-associated lipoprotein Pal [Caldimonas thermodepolymerans]PPE71501.1 peptidoglycan-associated lipoprotein Pal [Caldimonas thermodepolymerans]QPC30528.1 peptidoglycan-associated lipoprotein Pal [Caldimonas thermodepolymerans]RDI02881.1 peptidoglycan-associated lipoprotein [Caldimonas thermodepolymerans]TCP08589.1 peptidoglycan-associated lipoprotein [Caldimonas thermodepolymerans]UZG43250.1 peptidoglycan-associated lipoprotein Pal [Caldimonas thermodepolymerans]
MKLRTASSVLAAACMLAVLAGCGSSVKLDETPVESRTGTPVDQVGGAQGGRAAQSQVSSVDLAGQQDAANQLGRVVYFDFDSYVIKDEYQPIIASYARTLSGNADRRVTIEGHTDERGGREYNLALGQKRAEAVRKALALLGVRDSQMEAVSYGEERPAVQGYGEEAWAKNRRAELNLR